MADRITVKIPDALRSGLQNLPNEVRDAIAGVVKDIGNLAFTRIKTATARDRGTLAAGWKKKDSRTKSGASSTISNAVDYVNVLEFGGYPVVSTKARKKKGSKDASSAPSAGKKKKKKKKKAKKPARVIGPVQQRTRTGPGFVRGNAILGGYPPGPRTQVAPGGTPTMVSNVSKQSPSGMVRQTLGDIQPRFIFDLEEAIDDAFNRLGGGA